ncbi:MAG: exoribonuclease II [Succinivibrio sp.]
MLLDNPALRALKNNFEKEKVKKEGFVKSTDRGFGFLEVDRDSYFIAPNDMKNVVNGDRIRAVIESDSNDKSHAVPEKLVEPYLKRFVGRVLFISGKLNIIPDHPSISIKIQADDKRSERKEPLSNGDWVICNLTSHALEKKFFRASVDELICKKDEPKAPWLVSLRRYDLPTAEPADEEFEFAEKDLIRKDLTDIPFVTIDSAHTEDMDDALYIERTESGFNLYVAIADPTGYISEESHINQIASHRAFSIYLPGRDIPMLPRVLSENLCSLRADEVRPALVGIICVAEDGEVIKDRTQFIIANIRSHGKLVYNEVSDYLEKKENATFTPTEEIRGILNLLVEFTKVRDAYRSTHAASFKNRPDYEFILKDNGALDHIEVNHRRIANQIVEEAMIVANLAAGDFLAKNLNSGIFNVHNGFDLQKKKDIVELLEKEKCPFDESKLGTIEEYNSIRRFALKNDNDYLDGRIRKLQEYSEISIVPGPHYALGVENYATWTSPIRKYGDMVNHRLIKSLIADKSKPTLPDEVILKEMNEARRTNRMAERDVRDWLYVEFLEKDIRNRTVFSATVFDISRGGLKVFLDENGAMLFIPFSYISENKEDLILQGDTGEAYVKGQLVKRLGDKLSVRVVEINKETRSIIGAPAEPFGGLILPDPGAVKKNARRPASRKH